MSCRSFMRVAGLLALAAMTSGCSLWSWPWPHETENTEGLGASPIGNFIRKDSGDRTDGLKSAIVEFVKQQTSAKGVSRKDAESLGMRCAPAPSTDCTYSGEFWSRTDRGLPSDSPHYGKRTIEHIDVGFSYLKPHEVVVQRYEHDVPDE
jgi:hypothetical protein